jgi:glycosyltransferase involved in cell wall biosynthesis
MLKLLQSYKGRTGIISHGINARFSNTTRKFKPINEYTNNNRFKILYVSKIDVHKHQYKVAQAILELFHEGYPIEINLIGSVDDKKSFAKLNRVMSSSKNLVVNYTGDIDYNELPQFYNDADLFIFASSCENLPNILLEAMSNMLPIASSQISPMPEVLKDTGVFFNPESVNDIKKAVKQLLDSNYLRQEKALKSFALSKEYSWKKTASETAHFLYTTAIKY